MSPDSDTLPTYGLPQRNLRFAIPPRTLNTIRSFPSFASQAEWEQRKEFIRQRILVSCGLYPLPEKTPLQAHIFDKIERDGYSIEKVYFQTYPGFYLAGNLYRPLPLSAPSPNGIPGILVAHGHWANGRMANEPDGSISARAITFARQGNVAFTYDMVGFNDTRQVDHKFANDLRHWLWGISLMGLQTWNSLRALDFLLSLPEVDPSRLTITGESGGGTQTMMLGAIDDRLAAVGPCVMVSHTMQGGCLCENAPGLRVDISNVEIAAAAAPKFQVIVGATGDWTRTTLSMEGPAVQRIYELVGVPERLDYALFDYGHNINQTSREAVYAFFGKHLNNQSDPEQLTEPPYTMEPVADLQVFPDDTPLPPDALSAEDLTARLIANATSQLHSHLPHNLDTLKAFQVTFRPAWLQTLALELPKPDDLVSTTTVPEPTSWGTVTRVAFGRAGRGDNIPARLYIPKPTHSQNAVLLMSGQGKDSLTEGHNAVPGPFLRNLLERAGRTVLTIDIFLTGERSDRTAEQARQVPFTDYFCTYNRTNAQERVQDLITAITYLREQPNIDSVTLIGLDSAGPLAILAAPAADTVIADGAQLDLTSDDALLTADLFVLGLRRLGDFRTCALLAAPHALMLTNTGTKFEGTTEIQTAYNALGAASKLRVEPDNLDNDSLVDWLIGQSAS